MSTCTVTDDFTPVAIELIKSARPELKIVRSPSFRPERDTLLKTSYLLIRSRTLINKELLDQAPDLQVIISATSGFDHIDLKETQKRNIKVMYTPEANVNSVVELTFGLMFSLVRNLPASSKIIADYKWKNQLPKAFELRGKTLGLIGLGRIGSQVAKTATFLGLNVSAYDPYIDDSIFKNNQIQRVGLIELLRSSDIISLHVPYTQETHEFINEKTLSGLGDETYLINTSRGRVINEPALSHALKTHSLKGAALDVFNKEPLTKKCPLYGLKNVVLTPHIGAYTEEAFKRAGVMAAKKLITFCENAEVSDALPPLTEWAKWL